LFSLVCKIKSSASSLQNVFALRMPVTTEQNENARLHRRYGSYKLWIVKDCFVLRNDVKPGNDVKSKHYNNKICKARSFAQLLNEDPAMRKR